MVGLTSIGSVLNAVFVDGGSRDMFVRSTQDGEELINLYDKRVQARCKCGSK